MNKVSIIVPVYNKQKQIKRCLNSLVKQTYKHLEIVVIDDGSTDQSLRICKKFSKEDSRIKIITKENEGVEIARLTGIKKCTGDYVTFVDSDDWIANNAVELLVNALEENNADISFGCFTRVVGKFGIIKKKSKNLIYSHNIISNEEFIENYLPSFCGWGDFPVNMCGKLYKRELLDNVELANLRYGEDLCFNLQVIPRATKIVSIPISIYFYRWGGVTTFINKRLFDDAINQYQFKTKMYSKYNRTDCIEMANFELFNFLISYIEMLMTAYKDKELLNEINQCISNEIFQNALNNISYDWFINSKEYVYIKNSRILELVESRKSKVRKDMMKKRILNIVNSIF